MTLETLSRLIALAHAANTHGKYDAAIGYGQQALRLAPDLPEALYNIGIAHAGLRHDTEASAVLMRVADLTSLNADAQNSIGLQLLEIGRFDEADRCLSRAIQLAPDFAFAYSNLGMLQIKRNRFSEAEQSFRKAIEIDPSISAAWANLAGVLNELGEFEESLTLSEKALELAYENTQAYINRGNSFMRLRRLDEAMVCYDKAIAIDADSSDAYNGRGNVLTRLRRLDEAMVCYDKAIAIDPDNPNPSWTKALLLLLLGHFTEGWSYYEWRFKVESLRNNYYDFQGMAWTGLENICGKRLLIYAEQGFGDVIQFCRYIPMLEKFGAKVVFQVRTPLVELVSSLNCVMTVVKKDDALPKFDAYCSLMSLPFVFKTTVDNIPSEIPYLRAHACKVEQWKTLLGNSAKIRVGLVWSGSVAHDDDAERSILLAALQPLLGLSVEWHSLQKEYRQHDLEVLNRHPEIHQHQDALIDYSDTAALIETLDLVISVDTSVVHVAGALGKPVWVLLPFVPDFRWLLDRHDSPWYPNTRLFRQQSRGDWSHVINDVKEALIDHIGSLSLGD